MNITSAQFVKGLVEDDVILNDGKPQVAFVGRSNVGKSSLINSLTKQKNLAKTSSFPGRTQQVNVFLVNKDFYFVDLPGYGFAKGSKQDQERIQALIYWYLLDSDYRQKTVVLIMDANIGPTENDMQMIHSLKERHKNIIVVANKVDKLKKSQVKNQLNKIQEVIGDYKIIPYSSESKIGISELTNEIFK
ncbi:MAG: ribosome biogenesis GTP-binding protein YihA/YsxC [Candidatus Doudnabacteria bacterium]|nr:ribosome biogenesis GTP-binding protein YihA/YsxC [Candidatus Doudnabacteria bacterium]